MTKDADIDPMDLILNDLDINKDFEENYQRRDYRTKLSKAW